MRRHWLQMTWWSGALGILAALHLGRAIAGVPVSVAGMAVPIWVSAVIGLLVGGVAIGLYWMAATAVKKALHPAPRGRAPHAKAPTAAACDAHHAEACGGLHAAVAADTDEETDDQE